MLDDRYVRAARNNAEWCDAVCRAHGNPGEFHDDIWLNRNAGAATRRAPPHMAIIP